MEGSRRPGDDCGKPQKKTGMEKKLQVVLMQEGLAWMPLRFQFYLKFMFFFLIKKK